MRCAAPGWRPRTSTSTTRAGRKHHAPNSIWHCSGYAATTSWLSPGWTGSGGRCCTLIALGADLRDRGIGLKVLEQGIDTATAEGRAMFGMLSVLAEFSVIWTRRDAHLPDLGVAA